MPSREDIYNWISQTGNSNIISQVKQSASSQTESESSQSHSDVDAKNSFPQSSLSLGSLPPSLLGRGDVDDIQFPPPSSLGLGTSLPSLRAGNLQNDHTSSLGLGSPPPSLRGDDVKDIQPALPSSLGLSQIFSQPPSTGSLQVMKFYPQLSSLGLGSPPPQLSNLENDSSSSIRYLDSTSPKPPLTPTKRKFSKMQKQGAKKKRRLISPSANSFCERDESFHPESNQDGMMDCDTVDDCPPIQNSEFPSSRLEVYSKDRVLGNPSFWARTWEKLRDFNPASLIDLSILDFNLLADWLENRETLGGASPPCYYIDWQTLQHLLRESAEISVLKANLSLPEGNYIPKKPVFLVLKTSIYETPILLVLNYEEGKALLLGVGDETPTLIDTPEWFRGIWRVISEFFDWDCSRSTVDIILRNWIPGKLEFGQKSASFFHLVITGEWKWDNDGWGRPTAPRFACSRLMLQQMFIKTLERCNIYGQSWKLLRNECQASWIDAPQQAIDDLEIGFLNFSWVRYSFVRLSNHLASCRICESHSGDSTLNPIMEDAHTSEGGETDGASEPGKPPSVLKPQKSTSTPQDSPSIDGTQLPACFDIEDDDYLSAPIQSQHHDIPPTDRNIWVFSGDGVQILPDCWTFWRDQGYRLHPTFFQTIPQGNIAIDDKTCLNPFPKPSQEGDCQPLNSTDGKSLSLSAQSFIHEAGQRPGTKESKRVFLQGKEREKGTYQKPARYLILDLEKDHISISTDSVDISVDLDSLIWVTSFENFEARSFELCLNPSWEQKAAFSTHNFVYVNLVSPPRDEDELNNPLSRQLQDVRLSRIPHLRLGFSGEGEQRINFYAFFPRMIRKNEKSGRYATLLPLPVQELWFDRVVIPSCGRAFKNVVGFAEYIPSTLAELHNRSGEKKQKHMLICEPTTGYLMKGIQQSIKEDPDLLSCFGSCFIVADGRGMKLATKQCVPKNTSERSYFAHFKLVQDKFPHLNWDQMMNRAKGELYLDLGISYHSSYEEALVGLWRLSRLRESFNALGMKQGAIHHLNTFGFYGGMKSEMKQKRKHETHLVSRISYCLAFELVRNPGNNEYLCGDRDTINRSKKFLGACKNWLELFSSGFTKSFGVRDEIRGLSQTILNYLPYALKQARDCLCSDPIIWIKSSTFFKFLQRRFTELLLLHEECFNARLPNYRFMSLIIAYLLRHSLVTPSIKNATIAQVFRELRFEEVMMGWGAFFLHDLDLKKIKLCAVPEQDSTGLIQAYKIPFETETSTEKEPPPLKLSMLRASEDYPWGERVTHSRLKELIRTVPNQLLKSPANFLPDPLKHGDSSPIFISFTHQIWLLLTEQFVHVPENIPENLEDAMNVWTLKHLKKICSLSSFLPTYDGLIQERTKQKPTETFGNRRKIFFPTPEELEGSPLQPFTNHSTYYLWSYHRVLETQTKQQIRNLDHDLDMIFSALQCLPASVWERKRYTIWKVHEGRLEFVVNASYYRIKGIISEKEVVRRRGQLNNLALKKKLHEKVYGKNSFRKHKRLQQQTKTLTLRKKTRSKITYRQVKNSGPRSNITYSKSQSEAESDEGDTNIGT